MSAQEPSQANANRVSSSLDAAHQHSAAERRALLATCVAAAVKGSEAVRSHAQNLSALEWEEKARADYVSAADRDSEAAIRELILSRHADAVIG